ncbi:MAG: methyltransferase domain-containing protein [Isosphaeraceae bacterium]
MGPVRPGRRYSTLRSGPNPGIRPWRSLQLFLASPHARSNGNSRLTLTTLATGWSPASGQPPHDPKLPQDINKQFADPDVDAFVKRFESESREVYSRREAVLKALGIQKKMAVADIGAGTGLYTRLFAEAVGPEGAVYAVDIAVPFLRHIEATAKKNGHAQVKTVRGAQDRVNLNPESIDLAFVCDVYHHVERPGAWLGSIRTALKPGGRFVVIEFDRARAKNRDFVKKHVRAEKDVFIREIEAAGFERIELPNAPDLEENFIAARSASRRRASESSSPAADGTLTSLVATRSPRVSYPEVRGWEAFTTLESVAVPQEGSRGAGRTSVRTRRGRCGTDRVSARLCC